MEAAAREPVTPATTGGVTVVGSDAPSDYHIAPRSENPTANPNPTPGSAPAPAPTPQAATAATFPAKKKRGRPRKYGPDGTVTMALSPKPISSAAPSPPVIDFSGSAEKQRKMKPASSVSKSKHDGILGCHLCTCWVPAKTLPSDAGQDTCSDVLRVKWCDFSSKWVDEYNELMTHGFDFLFLPSFYRVGALGSAVYKFSEVTSENLNRVIITKVSVCLACHFTGFFRTAGEWVACSVGANFTPHIITVNTGEDVTMKIISFSQQGPRAICILSANGVISSVTLRQPDSSGGTLTYEGRFEILSLSGSFMPSDSGGTRSRSGGMSVSLASPDGRVVGGGVAGLLVAASPVQVVVGSFLAGNQHEQKPKKQKHEPISIAAPTAAVPISSADPKGNFTTTFRGDSWSPLPSDSRSKPTDINASQPVG
ncbi:hypothetical protein Patl1_18636 [Pistacia atlantica]|uniref:Uncharacterized protein n=1 Tax=Pistacia atlantica TaxID=434234 RepID=A0ACC1C303_9ROSI|nr:hypothetical protein Patl1_18636 [Pistacia atlantica]